MEHNNIRFDLVYYVNHYVDHKSRLVADGHLTYIKFYSVYYGGFPLRVIQLLLFFAEINKIEMWATDISNTYLE